jgi:hypothetical protein
MFQLVDPKDGLHSIGSLPVEDFQTIGRVSSPPRICTAAIKRKRCSMKETEESHADGWVDHGGRLVDRRFVLTSSFMMCFSFFCHR